MCVVEQQAGDLIDERRRNERLIALHVHDYVALGPLSNAGNFSDAVCARRVRGSRHHNGSTERLRGTRDASVVSGNDDSPPRETSLPAHAPTGASGLPASGNSAFPGSRVEA